MPDLSKRMSDYEAYLLLKNFSKQTMTSYLRTLRVFDEFRRHQKTRGRYSQDW